MKVELKKYLGRQEHLLEEKEWKDLSISYGLVKDESFVNQENGGRRNEETDDHDQQDKEAMEEAVSPCEEES